MTKRRYGTLFYGYLFVVSAFLFYVGVSNVRERDPWGMGDWLINYAGGFVRRGLIGQLLFDLSRHTPHVTIYVWTFATQIACYAMMFGVTIFLLRGLTWKLWMIAAVYSPATLSFTVFDPGSGFRKEILYFALLAAIIFSVSTSKHYLISVALFLALAMAALVLTHEGTLFYYPYIVCAFLIALGSVKQALLVCLPGAIAGAAAFVTAFKNPGGMREVKLICSSLGARDVGDPPCGGALAYMTKTASMAHQDVFFAISYWHLKYVMPFLLIMALGPIFVGMFALWRYKDQRFGWWAFLCCSLSAWLLTLALFAYATDWHRWIYVHVLSSLMLMLMIEGQHQRNLPAPQASILPANPFARYATVVLLTLSMVGWQLSFYHHFPLPGERLAVYLRYKIRGQSMIQKIDVRLLNDSKH